MTEPPPPRLSLVVPAYNEENRIAGALARIGGFLSAQTFRSEVIVVDDGSGPAGRSAVEEALASLPEAIERRAIRHEANRGKGAAVRSGCLAARGDYVAFIDADLATPPEDLAGLLAALDAGADVAIGVRRQPDGSDLRDRRNRLRRAAGYAYAAAVRVILLPQVEDSQCPLKAFRRDAAQRLFPLQRIDTWAFDAELLFLAGRMALRIAKVPVSWRAVQGSHLRLGPRTAVELWNLLRIRWWHRSVDALTRPREAPAPR